MTKPQYFSAFDPDLDFTQRLLAAQKALQVLIDSYEKLGTVPPAYVRELKIVLQNVQGNDLATLKRLRRAMRHNASQEDPPNFTSPAA